MRRFNLKNKLPLVISTSLLVGVPALPAFAYAGSTGPANSNIKKEWKCLAGPDGKWVCGITTQDVGPVFNAKVISSLSKIPSKKGAINKQMTGTQSLAASKKVAKPSKESTTGCKERATSTLPPSVANLDWTRINNLPASFPKDQQTLLCQGNYLEPDWPGRYFKGDTDKAPITANADKYNYKTQGVGILKGHVQIEQGNRLITSNVAHFNQDKNKATFKGDVIIRQPGMLIVGTNGEVNTKTNDTRIDHAQYVMQKQHVRGSASHAEHMSDGKIKMHDATYTSTPPGDNSWLFSAEKLTLDPSTGWGIARNAVLRISDIPVFYTPYANFPIDSRRKTGLLYPTISLSGDNGFEYTQPIYLNIAPNYDDTITPRYMSERGFMLSNQFRYLQPDFSGELGGSYLFNKDPVKQDNPYYDKSRWFFYWKHHQQFTQNWDATIDYSKSSDKNFLHDFGENDWSLTSTNPLTQNIQTRYSGSKNTNHPWSLTAQATAYQNMSLDSNNPYNRLPELTLQGAWRITPRINADYTVDYTDFERAKDWMYLRTKTINSDKDIYHYLYGQGTGLNNAEGGRLYASGQLKYRIDRTYGFWESGAQYRGTTYNLSNLNLSQERSQLNDPTLNRSEMDNPSMFAPTFYTGGGLYFKRDFSFGKEKFTQTLEPHIQYVYTPYVKNQDRNPDFDTGEASFTYNSLWQTERFSGYDRIGDTNHISLGVTTHVLDDQGIEKFRFGIGQIVYLQRRRAFLDPTLIQTDNNNDSNRNQAKERLLDNYKSPVSPLATQLVWTINPEWSLQQDYMYNTRYHYTDQYHLGATWKSKHNAVFNIGYQYLSQSDRLVYQSDGNATSPVRYADGDLNAIQTSFALPITYTWKILGLWSYDVANNRDLTRMIGLQKDTCSYRVRLVYRSYIDQTQHVETARLKHGMFLQFTLKGLGSVMGSNVDTFLKDINGYQPEDE